MGKTPLYKMLQKASVLRRLDDGDPAGRQRCRGSQLLLQAGKPVWQAGPADFTAAAICPNCRAAPPRVYS